MLPLRIQVNVYFCWNFSNKSTSCNIRDIFWFPDIGWFSYCVWMSVCIFTYWLVHTSFRCLSNFIYLNQIECNKLEKHHGTTCYVIGNSGIACCLPILFLRTPLCVHLKGCRCMTARTVTCILESLIDNFLCSRQVRSQISKCLI